MSKPGPWLAGVLVGVFTLAAHFAPATGCPGGRFVITVEAVQRQNWIEKAPTVFDRKESFVRLPAWLGRLTVVHASQGFLLSGEERLGQWTKVTVPPSVTVTLRIFGRAFYWPLTLPVTKDIKACRDSNGDLYVR